MIRYIYLTICFLQIQVADAQGQNIKGTVYENDKPLSYATVGIPSLNKITQTDSLGRFTLNNIPKGNHLFKVSLLGYVPHEQEINIDQQDITLAIKLQSNTIKLKDVTISGARYEQSSRESATKVSAINQDLLWQMNAASLADGLKFQSGLRVENNCANCGFTQIRLNGLEGPYTQVLINSRPIFSALAGVYGLEHIPTHMIERIEVIKGGASALYGANAIAGTVNVITKTPIQNEFQAGITGALIDGKALDRSIFASADIVDQDMNQGFTLYGLQREREYWDANDDGFSEITALSQQVLGFKHFFKPSTKIKVSSDLHIINESRRGGNLLHLPPHLTDIAEALDHRIIGGGINVDYISSSASKWQFYTAGQRVLRDSYYGGGGNEATLRSEGLSDDAIADALSNAARFYGNTTDFAWNTGVMKQYFTEINSFTLGVEWVGNKVDDQMPGYGRSIVQTAQSIGLYAQHEWKPNPKWTVLSGIRADQNIIDGTYTLGLSDNEITFNALTINPRVQLMHLIDETWQFRTGFSTGYRAPQAFDEDLHIETVNGAAQFVQLSNDLRPERSQSFSAGLYKDAQRVKDRIQLSVEGFYTLLNDPFIQVGLAESTENAPEIFEKRNSPIDAQVAGMNLEFNWTNTLGWEVQSGFTIQKAIYESPVEIYELADESTIQTRNILRTPNLYGHVIGSYKWNTKWRTSLNVDYTGRMEVPYEGPAASLAIRTVRDFYEVNASVERYVTFNQHTNVTIKLGVQNIFNAYQNDFDTGRFRDAAYIYGPMLPRSITFGIQLKH